MPKTGFQRILSDIFERVNFKQYPSEHEEWQITASSQQKYHGSIDNDFEKPIYNEQFVCAVCGNQKLRLIYYKHFISKEPEKIYEFVCEKCWNYSLYRWSGF